MKIVKTTARFARQEDLEAIARVNAATTASLLNNKLPEKIKDRINAIRHKLGIV
jgi:hypothetical protein